MIHLEAVADADPFAVVNAAARGAAPPAAPQVHHLSVRSTACGNENTTHESLVLTFCYFASLFMVHYLSVQPTAASCPRSGPPAAAALLTCTTRVHGAMPVCMTECDCSRLSGAAFVQQPWLASLPT